MRPAFTCSMSKAMIVRFPVSGGCLLLSKPFRSGGRHRMGPHGQGGNGLACDRISRCLLRTHSSFAFY